MDKSPIQCINQFGEKIELRVLRTDKHGIKTDYGYWNFSLCLSCFNNSIFRTKLKCLGSCSNQERNRYV